MEKLANKIALVTGGSNGIGFATAVRLVEEGAYVYITGRRQAELDAAVKKIGRNVTGVQGDVAKPADLDRLFAAIKAQHGHLDILFANAGVYEMVPLADVTEEHFDRIFDINVKGLLFTVQKAVKLMGKNSSIILNGSVVSIKGFPAASVYSATKGAVRSFARTWSVDLKEQGIRVNVVSPGPVLTEGSQDMFGPGTANADMVAGMVAAMPRGRLGEPDDIAKAVSFLASDDSSWITGLDLFVDGGLGQI
jgi:NAD(P)-dependent dehydrogenase (short-subunit alcohol dehydrogenase family)